MKIILESTDPHFFFIFWLLIINKRKRDAYEILHVFKFGSCLSRFYHVQRLLLSLILDVFVFKSWPCKMITTCWHLIIKIMISFRVVLTWFAVGGTRLKLQSRYGSWGYIFIIWALIYTFYLKCNFNLHDIV